LGRLITDNTTTLSTRLQAAVQASFSRHSASSVALELATAAALPLLVNALHHIPFIHQQNQTKIGVASSLTVETNTHAHKHTVLTA